MKKNYERAESEETKKDKKNHIENKQEFVRGHSFMTSAKKPKFRILTPFSFLFTNIEFLSKQTPPLLDVLDWNAKPWVISEFSWKTIAIRSTLSRIAFFWLMHIVFAILVCIIKLPEKPRVFHQPDVPLVFPLQNYK